MQLVKIIAIIIYIEICYSKYQMQNGRTAEKKNWQSKTQLFKIKPVFSHRFLHFAGSHSTTFGFRAELDIDDICASHHWVASGMPLPSVTWLSCRFFTNCVSQRLVVVSSFSTWAKVLSFSWSGRHWRRASRALRKGGLARETKQSATIRNLVLSMWNAVNLQPDKFQRIVTMNRIWTKLTSSKRVRVNQRKQMH